MKNFSTKNDSLKSSSSKNASSKNDSTKRFLTKIIAGIVALFFIAVATLSVKSGFDFAEWGIFAEKSTNLALQRGVKATCDSVEVAELSAEKAIKED